MNPTNEREQWFLFRKMANSRTNHVLVLAGRELGLAFKELSTNCCDLRAGQADSSDWNYPPSKQMLQQKGQLCGPEQHFWMTPCGSTKPEQQQTGGTHVLPVLQRISSKVNRRFTGRKKQIFSWLTYSWGIRVISWKKINFLPLYLLSEFVEKSMLLYSSKPSQYSDDKRENLGWEKQYLGLKLLI